MEFLNWLISTAIGCAIGWWICCNIISPEYKTKISEVEKSRKKLYK